MSWHGVALALSLLALLANALVIAALVGFLLSRGSATVHGAWETARDVLAPYALPAAVVVAAVATLGSLYFQFGAGFTPCDFCWFQRICMYPESLLLGIAAARRDLTTARWYVLPLAVVGSCISIYQTQLQWFPTQVQGNCASAGGVSCSSAQFLDLGFVSIPYLAGSAFLLVITLLLMARHPDEVGEGVDEEEDVDEAESAAGSGPSRRPALSR